MAAWWFSALCPMKPWLDREEYLNTMKTKKTRRIRNLFEDITFDQAIYSKSDQLVTWHLEPTSTVYSLVDFQIKLRKYWLNSRLLSSDKISY